MADVEIMPIFILWLERVSNMVAATPGLLAMPAPITETRPIVLSVSTPWAPIVFAVSVVIYFPIPSCSVGTVKEISVTPCSDVFCTIMSTLTC